MEVKITTPEGWRRVLEVEVPREELEPHFEKAYRKYQKKITLEGFRKGKVPLSLIKRLFGKQIEAEAIDKVIPEVYKQLRQEKGLKPVAPADIDQVSYDREQGLTFRATVDVEPEFELKDYKGIRVEKEIQEITEEDVEQALENLREGQATVSTVEGEAREGHYVLADFQELDQSGVPVIGKKYEDRYIQLDLEDDEISLSDQLIGVKQGEVRRIKLYRRGAEGDTDQETQWFSVKVKEIQEKKLPELDDELAKDVGDFKNLEDLKAFLRRRLEVQAQVQAQQRLNNRIADETIKRTPFDLPESMINNYLDAIVESIRKDSKEEIDEPLIRQNYRASAIWNLKWLLIRDKIAEMERIEVTDEDVKDYIRTIARGNDRDEDKLRNSFKGEENQRRMRDDILEEKVLEFLISHAQIEEKTIKRKDQEEAGRLII